MEMARRVTAARDLTRTIAEGKWQTVGVEWRLGDELSKSGASIMLLR